MNIKKVYDVLKTFKNNTKFKSILIDGPWGCGKTFEVKEFLKKNKRKTYYLSLFGLESIDEINSSLYEQVHSRKVEQRKNLMFISKMIQIVPKIGSIGDALEYQLGITEEKDINKRVIIVFDDLERLSKHIDYSDLLGYFNKLFLSGCRIICLISSEHIKAKNRKDDFDDFKEKVFDSFYVVDSVDNQIFQEIFKEYKMPRMDTAFSMFNSNIRFASKIQLFYATIIKHLIESDVILDDETKLDILKASICSIHLCFDKYKKYKPKNDEEIEYQVSCEYHGKKITDGIYYMKNNEPYKECFRNGIFERIIYGLLDVYTQMDYSLFDSIFIKNSTEIQDNVLNETFYYLSADHKIDYIHELEKTIKEGNFEWDNRFEQIIASVYNFSNYEFNEEQINIIARKIISSSKLQNNNTRSIKFDFIGLSDGSRTKGRIDSLVKNLENEVAALSKCEIKRQFEQSFETHDYQKMLEFLDKFSILQEYQKNEIINNLIENSFYLPDLSGDINHNEWTYAHSVARFAYNNNMKDEFISSVKQICKNSNNNETLIDRVHALIFYNIDNSFSIEELYK